MDNNFDIKMKVGNALAYLIDEFPNKTVSISEVCRLAGVNRANLYSTYPDVVNSIRLRNESLGELRPLRSRRSADSSNRNVDLLRKIKALTCICVELKLRNDALESRLALLADKKGRKKEAED